MRWTFRSAVSASLALHIAIGAAATRPWHGAPPPPSQSAETRANLTGDTIDVTQPGEPESADPASATSTSTSASTSPGRRGARAKPRAGAIGAASGEKGEGGDPGLFGAVGERGAVDLATAFTRQFPQAASTDAAWTTLAFGGAGEADVTLVLDEAGKLVQTTVSSGAPTALRNGVARTLSLIRGRPFTSTGARTRLHVRATVSHDQVHDGLHGDVFAIGGSFSRTEGSAFFALAIGRRIDFHVTAR